MDPHPNLEDFLARVATLTDREARVLAELARVPDWRLGNKVNVLMMIPVPGRGTAYAMASQGSTTATRDAIGRASDAIGAQAVVSARIAARGALARRGPTWRGEALHRPLGIVTWGAIVTALGALALGSALEGGMRDVALYVSVAAIVAFAVSMSGSYMLPPSLANLRSVVEEAAIGHAAAAGLSQTDVDQLTGGWYAVLEGRWQPYPRPYALWAAAILFVLFVVVLFLVVPPLARELGIEG